MESASIGEKRQLQRYISIVEQINNFEPQISSLTEEQLRQKTGEFIYRLENGETLDLILSEAFAVVREASKRVLNMRHYDCQLIGGIVLHEGQIAEMQTGEGKTLVATLPAYLNALNGSGVHIVTVNEYLAQRDAEWMGKIYEFLGLKVDVLKEGMSPSRQRTAYNANILYTSAQCLCFSHLSSTLALRNDYVGDVACKDFVIVDEADNVMIDNSRDPLIIANQSTEDSERLTEAMKVAEVICAPYEHARNANSVPQYSQNSQNSPENSPDLAPYISLVKDILRGTRISPEKLFSIREKFKQVSLNQTGLFLTVEVLKQMGKVDQNFTVGDLWSSEFPWGPWIERAVTARLVFVRDKDYVVHEGKIMIIDPATGRSLERTRWQNSIHQLVELKEGVDVKKESYTSAQITYQQYFRKYKKLSGMTGTALSEKMEFHDIYGVDVVAVPPNRPCLRIDHPPQVFMESSMQLFEIWRLVKISVENQRPVLIGTNFVGESELIGHMLNRAWEKYNEAQKFKQKLIKYTESSNGNHVDKQFNPDQNGNDGNFVLNATQNSNSDENFDWDPSQQLQILNAKPEAVKRESQIIAQAGLPGRVTIATSMAGRGTDILLGGDPLGIASIQLMNDFSSFLLCKNAQKIEELDYIPDTTLILQQHKKYVDLKFETELILRAQFQNDGEEENFRFEKTEEFEREVRDIVDIANTILQESDINDPNNTTTPIQNFDAETQFGNALTQFDRHVRSKKFKNKEQWQKQLIKISLYILCVLKIHCAGLREKVLASGGLLVINTSLGISSRIERQLRGRTGRQGDRGETFALYSMEDTNIRIFGGLQAASLLKQQVQILDGKIVDIFINSIYNTLQSLSRQSRYQMVEQDEVLEEFRSYKESLRKVIAFGSETEFKEAVYFLMKGAVFVVMKQYQDKFLGLKPGQWPVMDVVADLENVMNSGGGEKGEKEKKTNAPDGMLSVSFENSENQWPQLQYTLQLLREDEKKELVQYIFGKIDEIKVMPAAQTRGLQNVLKISQSLYTLFSDVQPNEQGYPLIFSQFHLAKNKKLNSVLNYLTIAFILGYEQLLNVAQKMPQMGDPTQRKSWSLTDQQRISICEMLDLCWADFLRDVDNIRSASSLNAFGDLDPKDEFKIQLGNTFSQMLDDFRLSACQALFQDLRQPKYVQMSLPFQKDESVEDDVLEANEKDVKTSDTAKTTK